MAQAKRAPTELQEHFLAQVPNRLLRALFALSGESVAAAFEYARQTWPIDQANGVIPALRRAHFESRMASLAVPGVTASVEKNQGDASCHALLQVGGVSLTALTRSHRPLSLPEVRYRKTLALSAQLDFFRGGDVPIDANLYAVYVYGGRLSDREQSIAMVVFPRADSPYLHSDSSIDLLREYTGRDSVPETEEDVRFDLPLKRRMRSENN